MKKAKQTVVKLAEKSFISIAEIFSILACPGRSYEPKMPQKLKK